MVMTALWRTLSIISLVAGAMCLAFSFFLPANSLVFAVTLALGVALLPAGLIAIITSISSSRIIRDELRETLRESAGSLEASLDNLRIATSFLTRSKELGLSMVYENRNQALEPFLAHLAEYVNRPGAGTKEIAFVASSLKGLIEDNPQYSDQMAKIIQQSQGRCRIRFLLTHPEYAKLRETQEDRPPGAIVMEILHAIDWLERRGVPLENIRVYKGEPTCFMIASTERMLLNPYPYEREASRNFSLIVENTESERSLFYNYWTHHYYRPWYGEEMQRDHFITPKSFAVVHGRFEGPVPASHHLPDSTVTTYGDFFVVKDAGSFWLGVNVRALESTILYGMSSDGTTRAVTVGDELKVVLLDLSTGSAEWQEVGVLRLNDIRNGFWEGTVRGFKAFDTYEMLGVFDQVHRNPFLFETKYEGLSGTSLPMLWGWLHSPQQRNRK